MDWNNFPLHEEWTDALHLARKNLVTRLLHQWTETQVHEHDHLWQEKLKARHAELTAQAGKLRMPDVIHFHQLLDYAGTEK
jgi:hypothetical protein